ncbi:MAG: molybdopterin-binding protein [Clostridia bacterium]|jgi:molybdopterin biosynthesis enzyme|nr:molybdopterin-binding protein [Clostridia bacterium]
MFTKAVIIPTGDELKAGIVLDTDSPLIMQTLLSINGGCEVRRIAPVLDRQELIESTIKKMASQNDLIVMIGGSGGGHRYSSTLGKDFTHSSLEEILEEKHSSKMYGKNGHMWCKLVCGKLGDTLVINVPGPFDEAKAAIGAFKQKYIENENDLKSINTAMMEAVKAKYSNVY